MKYTLKDIRVKILLYSIVVAIVTLRAVDCTVDPGLDAPFRWALNYLIYCNREAFSYVQYTVGPLCLLKWPAPMGDHIIISTFFHLSMATLFTYLFVRLYSKHRITSQLSVPLLTCTVFLLVVNSDIVMLGCVLLQMLDYHVLKNKRYPYLAILLTVLGVYIKTSLFVLLGGLWLAFAIYLLTKRCYKYLLVSLAIGISTFLLVGILLLGQASSLIHFAWSNVLFAYKYSDLLSLYPINNWYYLGGCLLSICLTFVLYRKQPGGFVIALTSICLFTCWKYSMGREDFFHSMMFAYFLLLVILLFFAVQKENANRGVPLLLAALAFFISNIQNTMGYRENYFWLPSIVHFNERVLHARDFDQRMRAESIQSCSVNVLPDDWRKMIGSNTVDVFPWDLSVIMINKFSYNPRPSLQSIGLNREVDVADAQFLASAHAPSYFVWHITGSEKTTIDGLDDQYLPNTCPATIGSIICNYQLTSFTNNTFAIWKKRTSPQTLLKKETGSQTITWGAWMDVPAHDSSSLVTARIAYSQTWLFKIREIVYKGAPVFIEYETDDGKILHYSFSRQCAENGLFINPIWSDNKMQPLTIKRIRFLNDRPSYFNEGVKVILERQTVSNGGI